MLNEEREKGDGMMERTEQERTPVTSVLRTTAVRTSRVIKMDGAVFREIAEDRSATPQALALVFLAAIATLIATVGDAPIWGALTGQLFLAYVGWMTGTLLVVVLSRTLLRAPKAGVEWTAIARAMGYAHAPLLLRVAAVLPGIGLAMIVLTFIWQGIAMLTGIKEVLGYQSYWKPLGILAIGLAPYAVIVAWFSRLL